MKRLAIISPSLAGGGAERVVATLLTRLDRSRFRPSLILFERRIDYSLPADVEVFDIGRPARIGPVGKAANLLIRPRKIAELVRDADIVLSMQDHANFHTMLARKKTGGEKRWVLGVQIHPEPNYRGLNSILYPAFMKKLYPAADAVIAASEGIRDWLKKICPAHVIHNPVDLEKVRADAKGPAPHEWVTDPKPYFIAMGRLVHQKGFDTLIQAFATVRERLIILGEGGERAALEAQAKALGVELLLPGRQENPFAWFRNAKAFVFSSRFEGFGLALAEAMALGVPVISTDCPSGPREILQDGKFGKLVPVEDPKALAEACLGNLTAHPERAEDFDAAKITRAYEDVIDPDGP